MFCKNCGKELMDGTIFCPQCGYRNNLTAGAPTQQAPTAGSNLQDMNDRIGDTSSQKYDYSNQNSSSQQYGYTNQNQDFQQYGYTNQGQNSQQYGYSNQGQNSQQYGYSNQEQNPQQYGYSNQGQNSQQYGYSNQEQNSQQYGYSNQNQNSQQYGYSNQSQNSQQYGYSNQGQNSQQYGYANQEQNSQQYGYTNQGQNSQQYDYVNQNPGYPAGSSDFEQEPPKKRKKAPFIIGGIAAAVAVIGGVCIANASSISNFARKTFSSPENYYRYVEEKALEEKTESLAEFYDIYLDRVEEAQKQNNGSVDISLRLEDGGRSMIAPFIPADISWLKEVSMKADVHTDESSLGTEMEVYLNDGKLASMHMAGDWNIQEIYLKIPELSAAYLGMNMADAGSDIGQLLPNPQEMTNFYKNIAEFCPDGETLEGVCNRYVKMLLENISEVETSKETVTLGAISKKTTRLQAKITEKDLAKSMHKICKELQQDKDVEKMIRTFAKQAQMMDPYGSVPDENTMYQQFIEAIQNCDSVVPDPESITDSDSTLLSNAYVDNSGNIIGRTFSLSEYGNETMLFSYGQHVDGKKFEMSAALFTDSPIQITGKGTISGSKENSSYTLSVNSVPMLTFELADFDTKELKKGCLNGSVTVRMESGMSDYISMDAMSGVLANCALKFTFAQSEKSGNIDVSVLSAELPLFTLSVKADTKSDSKADFPSSDDPVYNLAYEDDILEYASTINWDEFLNQLRQTDIPGEYLDTLQSGISEFVEMLENYNNY